jgi:hypothetical protein
MEIIVPSSRGMPDLRRQIFLGLASKVEGQLRDLYEKRGREGVNQTMISKKLGCNKSLITRRLNGRSNMTIETLADMVWAGGGCVTIDIFDPKDRVGSNERLPPHEDFLIHTRNDNSVASFYSDSATRSVTLNGGEVA